MYIVLLFYAEAAFCQEGLPSCLESSWPDYRKFVTKVLKLRSLALLFITENDSMLS